MGRPFMAEVVEFQPAGACRSCGLLLHAPCAGESPRETTRELGCCRAQPLRAELQAAVDRLPIITAALRFPPAGQYASAACPFLQGQPGGEPATVPELFPGQGSVFPFPDRTAGYRQPAFALQAG